MNVCVLVSMSTTGLGSNLVIEAMEYVVHDVTEPPGILRSPHRCSSEQSSVSSSLFQSYGILVVQHLRKCIWNTWVRWATVYGRLVSKSKPLP